MSPKQLDMLKFVGALFIVLLVMGLVGAKLLGLEPPWKGPPPAPTEPRPFDLTNTDTMVRQFDPARGMVAVQDLRSVAASGRCAVVAESMQEPTPAGYHFVFNALEFPSGTVTAYPVQTAQLEDLVTDCVAAGSAAEAVAESAQDILSEVKIAKLEAAKAEAQANPPEPKRDDGSADPEAMINKMKDGNVNELLEGLLGK